MRGKDGNKIPGAEIMLAVMALFFQGGSRIITERSVYTIFSRLAKEFSDDFGEWTFGILPSSRFPYCGEFEDVLFRGAGCLLRTGPQMSSFTMNERMGQIILEKFEEHHGKAALGAVWILEERFLKILKQEKID
ncbi:MAG: hypothetical protein V1845_02825 [bacterium]